MTTHNARSLLDLYAFLSVPDYKLPLLSKSVSCMDMILYISNTDGDLC